MDLLDRLKGAPLIGMDSEWRPLIKPFSTERLAILQLSSHTDTFIIDLVALGSCQALDDKLVEIFSDQRSLCIGFSFTSDISMFNKSLPAMDFYKYFARFLDI